MKRLFKCGEECPIKREIYLRMRKKNMMKVLGKPWGGKLWGGLPWGRLLGVLLIAGLAASCAKEDKDIEIANQETKIDNYINNLGDAYEVVRKDGSNRVIVTAGTGSQTLEEGDSLYYYYSGYIFSGNGKGAIFVTNRKEDAEQFNIEPLQGLGPAKIKYGSEPMVRGLQSGLYGVKEGENCYIIFSAKYGYYDSVVGVVPSLSPLFYDIIIDKIIKNRE
ncbi:MAG: FKBP-type peptidyl-prolyl cis-trans isomerase [bacterium]|nr:FKBP-type peptidyl-prolyl cis-trans isomerase [bacterium]